MASAGPCTALAVTRIRVLPALSADGYTRHTIHSEPTLWIEKNCYVDVIIELVHALGLEPIAAMGFCAAVDFEGDNFTFFKPQHEELRELYGIDIQELNVWRPLLEHAEEHLAAGKFLSTEADAFWLPDTAGTDYKRNHVKTTIIIAEVDAAEKRVGYFHNAAYYEMGGEEFDQLFGRVSSRDLTVLPFFAELVRIDRLQRRRAKELAAIAVKRLAVHLARRPRNNPVERFGARFISELPRLQELGIDRYHAWAFATTRQLGASMELFAAHLRWLAAHGGIALDEPAADFQELSELAKTLILKAARAVSARKPLDSSLLERMAGAWARGMQRVEAHVPPDDIASSSHRAQ